MNISDEKIFEFRKFIWDFYREQGRTFVWRNIEDPYRVLVSEIMLQQTQTYRVEPKYEQFITMFANWDALASASLRDVLSAWQGLGYNRRGAYLHQTAQKVVQEFGGILPRDPRILETFPGIGKATAASICAFAFNEPVVFIETNIRAVFIHSFFAQHSLVHDKEIFPLVGVTVDHANAREWYYALMDYGVYLKKNVINPSRQSVHHAKQSKFEGSDRQIRGAIIRVLASRSLLSLEQLLTYVATDLQIIIAKNDNDVLHEKKYVTAQRIEKIILQVCNDGLIIKKENCFYIP